MNTKENNKLIAEFMDILYGYTNVRYNYLDIKGAHVNNGLHFHESWEWLMPVVEKIEQLGYGYYTKPVMFQGHSPTSHYIFIGVESTDFSRIEVKAKTRLAATYKAVVEFIKWCNEQ